MTVDEIMKLANAYASEVADHYGSQQDEDEACGKLRAALEAQSARIAELEGLLQQAEVNLVDAYDMCMEEIDRASPAKHLSKRIDCTTAAIRSALHQEVKP